MLDNDSEITHNDNLVEKSKIIKEADIKSLIGEHFYSNKQEIFLTLSGLKPVSMIGGIDSLDLPKVTDLLNQIGLYYQISKEYPETIFVSKNQENIILYKSISEQGKVDKTNKNGLLLGFPESAVEAFDKNDCLGYEDQRRVTEALGINPDFTPFRLSRWNYKEEIKIIAKWYNTLRLYDLLAPINVAA